MDITGPYPVTPRQNKYLLTFVDHFSKYAEIYPIPDQSAVTCAKVYALQIITRHGSGSKLITDQGAAFMSSFFNETCQIMGDHKSHTSSYHPMSNGHVERMHRTLHTALSHYVNQSHTDWDLKVPLFLMAYHSTPHSTTGYSPFYLLHGREMVTPANENLEAKVPKPTQALEQQLEDLKWRLKTAFMAVASANQRAHRTNKTRYDRRAKVRKFKKGELVYLFNPAVKPRHSRKFHFPWSGPFQITAKLSDLNYELMGHQAKKFVVHVNRLKPCFGHAKPEAKPTPRRRIKAKPRGKRVSKSTQEVANPPAIATYYSLVVEKPRDSDAVDAPPAPETPPSPTSETPSVRNSEREERSDPTYNPPDTPRSKRNLTMERKTPPVTRSQTRINPPVNSINLV
jgi:hypothetical protein